MKKWVVVVVVVVLHMINKTEKRKFPGGGV